MAKEIKAKVKLQCPGGAATPAPPVGPALGQHGVNIGDFVRRFNDATSKDRGTIIPVELTVYTDRSFDFVLKSPPAAVLLKQAAGLEKGSPTPNTQKVGKVTAKQVLDNLDVIAKAIPGLKYIQIDDGYQPAMGDWLLTGAAFGGGVQDVLKQIRNKGFEPAIWIAPFIAEKDHGRTFIAIVA